VYKPHVLRLTVLAAATLMASTGAHAFKIETGHRDVRMRWDTSIKASAKARTEHADSRLMEHFHPSGIPQALNFNAGDQNFQKRGLFSARLDLLSEFDLVWKRDFGLRISGAAWYDDYLHKRTHANPDLMGQVPYDRFPSKTRRMAGQDAEILDAFVFAGWQFDNGMKLTTRLGRHALQWGESLFFGDNGIARAQGPTDIDKLLASPNAQFKEIIRPVAQLSAQLQITAHVSIGGYYQFEWEEDRLPAAGSYFSTANVTWGAHYPEFTDLPVPGIGGSFMLNPGADIEPTSSGQYGLQLKWRLGETDLGFYYARYHDKGGQLYGALRQEMLNPALKSGAWYYLFPESIKTFGASASRSLGAFNFAGEMSVRDDMPLRSENMFYFAPFQSAPQHATGRTLHANVSMLSSFGPGFIAQESSLVAEIAWQRVLHADDPDHVLDHGRSRDATVIQLIYTPSYRQARPGLDLSIPVGLRYTLDGYSAISPWDPEGSGSFNLGLEGVYLGVWQFGLTYTHYIGKVTPFLDYTPLLSGGTPIYGHGNPLRDRNFLSFNLRRTF